MTKPFLIAFGINNIWSIM